MSILDQHPLAGRLWEWYRDILDFFFPPQCVSCHERLLEGDEYFCSGCHGAFEPVPLPHCPLCGAPTGNKVLMKNRCPACPEGEVFYTRARAPLLYQGPVVDGIVALKFHRRLELTELFARVLLYYLKRDQADLSFDGIVPVPLHYRRFHQRGYNQSEEIGRVLSRHLGITLWAEVLRRTRYTRPQTRLAHRERRGNVQDAFEVVYAEPVRDRRVLLLDDVYTTGSTMNACARVLKEAGAREVTALTVCRAIGSD